MQIAVKLKIAGIIIHICSDSRQIKIPEKKRNRAEHYRFHNFFYRGSERPRIVICVCVVDRLPETKAGKNVFISSHFDDNREHWRIIENGGQVIYRSPLEDAETVAFIQKRFSRVQIYLLPKRKKGKVWELSDIIYNFLEILLINYLAIRSLGVFAHGAAIRDLNKSAMLFCGKSGGGKSTLARIWFKNSNAVVLNDDRVIVRREGDGFSLHSSPWTGEFTRYLRKKLHPAPLGILFFIHHGGVNTAARIDPAQAFRALYPTIFPPFWNRQCLENTARFCQRLVQKIPCYRIWFAKNKKVISFVREIEADERAAV